MRSEALLRVDGLRSLSASDARGGLGYLAAASPTVRRFSLEMTDRLAEAMATAIAESGEGLPLHLARLQGLALAWVFQTITDEAGRRGVAGQEPSEMARELDLIVEDLLDSHRSMVYRRRMIGSPAC